MEQESWDSPAWGPHEEEVDMDRAGDDGEQCKKRGFLGSRENYILRGKVWSTMSDKSEMKSEKYWKLITGFPMMLIGDYDKSCLREGGGDT